MPARPFPRGLRRSVYQFVGATATILLIGLGGEYVGKVEIADEDLTPAVQEALEQFLDLLDSQRGKPTLMR
jgi:hypothetical protein